MNLRWSLMSTCKKAASFLHQTKNGERRTISLAGLALQLLTHITQNEKIKGMKDFEKTNRSNIKLILEAF